MKPPESFPDYVRSGAGRVQLGRWMGGGALVFSAAFAVFAWYAHADVPLLFWPIIAGGGALMGLRVCHLRWLRKADRAGDR